MTSFLTTLLRNGPVNELYAVQAYSDMATPEETKQDAPPYSAPEGGEVSAFRLAGPRLGIKYIVKTALV